MKRIVLLAAMLAMMALLAAPALAVPPENPGFETGIDHARSICSFSGLNHVHPEEAPTGRTQSYGQEVRHGYIEPSEVKSGPPSPGIFCNPEKGPFEGPFVEPVE